MPLVDLGREHSAKEIGVDKSMYRLLNISRLLASSALLRAGYNGLIFPETFLYKRRS
jgi:hypothetical protein